MHDIPNSGKPQVKPHISHPRTSNRKAAIQPGDNKISRMNHTFPARLINELEHHSSYDLPILVEGKAEARKAFKHLLQIQTG